MYPARMPIQAMFELAGQLTPGLYGPRHVHDPSSMGMSSAPSPYIPPPGPSHAYGGTTSPQFTNPVHYSQHGHGGHHGRHHGGQTMVGAIAVTGILGLALLGVGLPVALVAKLVGASWLKAVLLGGVASTMVIVVDRYAAPGLPPQQTGEE